MGRKRDTSEQIIGMLQETEVLQKQGMTIGEVSRKLGFSEQTYYRWRHTGFNVYSKVKTTSKREAEGKVRYQYDKLGSQKESMDYLESTKYQKCVHAHLHQISE